MTESTSPVADRHLSYRDPSVWTLPLAELALLGLFLLLDQRFQPHLVWPWVAGLVVIVVSAALTAARARRGLTLSADGLTWHKHQIFVPWSNVAGVALVGDRVLVRVVEPDQLRDRRWLAGLTETPWNRRRYGAPIALKARRLAVPAEQFVAEAEGRRAAFERGHLRAAPQARGAFRTSVLNAAGVALALFALLFADFPAEKDVFHQRVGMLAFEYRANGQDADFVGRLLIVRNYERVAVAPTLAFTARDADGHALRGVTVRTAFGSDQGLVANAGRGWFREALAFDGPEAEDVRSVRVTVRGSRYSGSPPFRTPGDYLTATPIDRSGGRLDIGVPFERVRVGGGPAGKARVVCVTWERSPAGRGLRLVASYDFGWVDVTGVTSHDVAVPAGMLSCTRECDALHVVYAPYLPG